MRDGDPGIEALKAELERQKQENATLKEQIVLLESNNAVSVGHGWHILQLSGLNFGILVEDRNGRITDVNVAFCRLFGFTDPHQLTGKNDKDLTVKIAGSFSDPKGFIETTMKNRKGAKPVFECELEMKDGRILELDYIPGVSVSHPDENVWVYKDITERRLTERALRRSEDLFELFFSQSYTGFYFMMIDRPFAWDDTIDKEKTLDYVFENLKFTKVNKAFLDQYHATEKDYIGRTLNDQFRDNLQHGRKVWMDFLNKGKKIRMETNEDTVNGQPMHVEGDYICMYDEKGRITGIFGVQLDVTQRTLAVKALRESEARLREIVAAKDKLLTIIAHDLRNPLSAILSLTEIIYGMSKDKDFENIGAISEAAFSSAKMGINFLNNMMEYANLQSGLTEFIPERILIGKLTANVIKILQANLEAKMIDLHVDIDPDLAVQADSFMIETVIRNLVSNAIKYTPTRGKIKIFARKTAGAVEVSVSDTGVGIKSEIIPELFKINSNYTTRGTNNEKGTGFGLILCQEFIQKHGGHISIASEVNKGSVFTFSIP